MVIYHRRESKNMGLRVLAIQRYTWDFAPALEFRSCVILSKSLDVLKPQFLHLKTRILRLLDEIMPLEYLAQCLTSSKLLQLRKRDKNYLHRKGCEVTVVAEKG